MTGPHGSRGLRCSTCDGHFFWPNLDATIISDGEGGLLWLWSCPVCHDVLRSEPFAYPPDMPNFEPVTSDDGREGCSSGSQREIRLHRLDPSTGIPLGVSDDAG